MIDFVLCCCLLCFFCILFCVFLVFCFKFLYQQADIIIVKAESGSESDADGSEDKSDEESDGGDKPEKSAVVSGDDEDNEEEEWARFQKGMNRREKALAGKSRVSHSVHCPFYTDDKQEFW